MSHTLSQLYKVCSKWLNLITGKLDLNKALIKQLLKNRRSCLGTHLGKHPLHPLQQQYCEHTGACVQQELSDLSGHSAPVLSLKVLYLSQLSPVFMYPHLPPGAQGNMGIFILIHRSYGLEVGFKYSG
jgi:hypothetical protein